MWPIRRELERLKEQRVLKFEVFSVTRDVEKYLNLGRHMLEETWARCGTSADVLPRVFKSLHLYELFGGATADDFSPKQMEEAVEILLGEVETARRSRGPVSDTSQILKRVLDKLLQMITQTRGVRPLSGGKLPDVQFESLLREGSMMEIWRRMNCLQDKGGLLSLRDAIRSTLKTLPGHRLRLFVRILHCVCNPTTVPYYLGLSSVTNSGTPHELSNVVINATLTAELHSMPYETAAQRKDILESPLLTEKQQNKLASLLSHQYCAGGSSECDEGFRPLSPYGKVYEKKSPSVKHPFPRRDLSLRSHPAFRSNPKSIYLRSDLRNAQHQLVGGGGNFGPSSPSSRGTYSTSASFTTSPRQAALSSERQVYRPSSARPEWRPSSPIIQTYRTLDGRPTCRPRPQSATTRPPPRWQDAGSCTYVDGMPMPVPIASRPSYIPPGTEGGSSEKGKSTRSRTDINSSEGNSTTRNPYDTSFFFPTRKGDDFHIRRPHSSTTVRNSSGKGANRIRCGAFRPASVGGYGGNARRGDGAVTSYWWNEEEDAGDEEYEQIDVRYETPNQAVTRFRSMLAQAEAF